MNSWMSRITFINQLLFVLVDRSIYIQLHLVNLFNSNYFLCLRFGNEFPCFVLLNHGYFFFRCSHPFFNPTCIFKVWRFRENKITSSINLCKRSSTSNKKFYHSLLPSLHLNLLTQVLSVLPNASQSESFHYKENKYYISLKICHSYL